MKTINTPPAKPACKSVRIPAGEALLDGDLELPAEAAGIVIFAHGSGSSRHSPRNQLVARMLRQAGMGTLLLDLLTSDEEVMDQESCELRFNIRLLADRLAATARWVAEQPETKGLKIGFFGASTGGGAALAAAAGLGSLIAAVVSRGGRPDLAGPFLPKVKAPTLLIVGGYDTIVIQMNEFALDQLRCEKELRIVPAASHLFEEPGKLKEAAELSARWLKKHLA